TRTAMNAVYATFTSRAIGWWFDPGGNVCSTKIPAPWPCPHRPRQAVLPQSFMVVVLRLFNLSRGTLQVLIPGAGRRGESDPGEPPAGTCASSRWVVRSTGWRPFLALGAGRFLGPFDRTQNSADEQSPHGPRKSPRQASTRASPSISSGGVGPW